MNDTRLRLGASLVALSYALAAFAAYAVFSTRPDLTSRPGRHLFAGALAIVSLSAVEILIAIFPLRRGEKWAFGAAVLPMVSLVLPMMLVDATQVSSGHLFVTLLPFVAGLALGITGLVLVGWHQGK